MALLLALVAGCVLCEALVASMLLFSAVCALLGSRFLSAFLCANVEAAVPAVLLVASMIVSPSAVAVGVDCLETGGFSSAEYVLLFMYSFSLTYAVGYPT